MIRTTFLSISIFLLTASAFAQQVINNCPIQPYTRCPGVNLRGADLSGVNLQGAYLKGADLRKANLTNANFIDTYLDGANLSGANLTGADFSKATWIDGRICGFGSIGQCN